MIPSTLCILIPWEDTSIIIYWHPLFAIWENAWCSCQDSGVVFMVGVTVSPMTIPVVPIIPTFLPAASNMALIIWVVVVFPFVPVTPMVIIFLAG